MFSGGIKGGGMGQSEALAPFAPPPSQKKKWPKSVIFGKFMDFGPLRIAFCPLDAPQISGSATGIIMRCSIQ